MPPARPSPRDLYALLDQCLATDARRLHAKIRHLQRTTRHENGPPLDEAITGIIAEIDRSRATVHARGQALTSIQYPDDLPVAARRDEIMAAVRNHQVVVVCGATGSGKTTQLPKMLLELGRGRRGFIGHTQPRRIAARAVASRIASELNTTLGQLVGYKVRFTDETSSRSLIKLMTDGILLAETQHDRYLLDYDTFIIDEAHERSLNIDFLLGYLRQLLPRRPDLKLVITSATIDPQSFANHFTLPGQPAPPVIEVSGRTYPVDVRYSPLKSEHPDEDDMNLQQGILHAVDDLSQDAAALTGDILIFLPGEREIRETAESLRKHALKPTHKVDVIPLYARLSSDEQQLIFQPKPGRRRIILATNVAETSLTVPGIKYVIDSGLARISRYSPRVKIQRLPIEPISQASANQRAGRCGRTSPGICIRLFSEADFSARPAFTDPEIVRTNLASVILQMKALDLGDIEDFPFIQPPDGRTVRDGYDTLLELNALESGGLRNELTPIGRKLAKLPLDPRLGRMLLAAESERCVAEVLVIAAALATQDPRERPMERANEADAKHALFREEGSDFLGTLKLWRALHEQQKKLSGGRFRQWCHEHFVAYMRFREWHDTHAQLRELLSEMGIATQSSTHPARPDQIHRAVLTGLLSSIGTKSDRTQRDIALGEGEFDGARGVRFNIFPGSVLFKKSPKWVMAAEIVKTTRTFARTAAQIQPLWIEPIAQHLVKRTYAEPHWDADLAQVSAYETVTLYGLEIVKRRRIDFSKIDPALSRTLLIHHALVEGEFLSNAKFLQHNHELTTKVKDLQTRARTSNLLADQAKRFAFYDTRIPRDVASVPDLDTWRRKAEAKQPTLLHMTKADVLAEGAVEPPLQQFPDAMTIDGRSCSIEYRADPAHRDDGLTLTFAADLLQHVSAQRIEWLVPGYLHEKVEALVRELPKGVRVAFVPIPQTIDAAIKRMKFAEGDLLESLTSALRQVTGTFVDRQHWKLDALPKHLRMNLRVVDAKGKVLAFGRDLAAIRRELTGQDSVALIRLPDGPWNRPGILLWDFGDIPESIDLPVDGRMLHLFPALTDEGAIEEVSLRLYTDAARAAAQHRLGLAKLFFLSTRRECRTLFENMPGVEKLKLKAFALAALVPGSIEPKGGMLIEQLAQLTAHRAWTINDARDPAPIEGENVRSKQRFEAKLNTRWTNIGSAGQEVAALATSLLTYAQQLEAVLRDQPSGGQTAGALLDVKVQLAYLFPPQFWLAAPWIHLREYPRYLSGILRRLDKLSAPDAVIPGGGLARDTRLQNELMPYLTRMRIRVEQGGIVARSDPALITYRWMLEEYRIALWGAGGPWSGDQTTIVPVSPKRLDAQWAKVASQDQLTA